MQRGFIFAAIYLTAFLTACSSVHPTTRNSRSIDPKMTSAEQPSVTNMPTVTSMPSVSVAPLPTMPSAYLGGRTSANEQNQPRNRSTKLQDEPEKSTQLEDPEEEKSEVDYATVRPYEVGQIMIIMYHGLVKTEAEENVCQRSVDNFKNDLQTFYDRGFRLISVKDWLDNNINHPAGYTPLILTFDDGLPSTFSLEYRDGELQPVENCAVDIMNKFAEKHPDFGNAAMLFINKSPFRGEGTMAERFKYLIDHGYEIGNHTMNHNQLSKMTAEEIQSEIGGIDELIKENVPGYVPYAISYPYGERPLKALHEYILSGEWEGGTYSYRVALREGQSGPPSAINRVGFDPINVPRVHGANERVTDMGWTLEQYEINPDLRYTSDGNPDRIAVPVEYVDNVDKNSLNGKELYIYDENGKEVKG